MKKNVTIIVLAAALVVGYLSIDRAETVDPIRGVSQADGYFATTTSSAFSNSKKRLCGGQSILGTLVIHTATAANLHFRDATSTTDVSSTTIAEIPASMGVGDYVYDVQTLRGLFVESDVGAWGTGATITCK
jgi:hypothetical protein